jgi:hypothetical protein
MMRAIAPLSFRMAGRMRIIVFTSLFFWGVSVIGESMIFFGGGEAEGKRFHFKIAVTDVRHTPVWYPNMPNPPLSPLRAIEIARRQLEQLVLDLAAWKVFEINLKTFGDNRWVYIVSFQGWYQTEGAGHQATYLGIPVLMNGALLEPDVKLLPGREQRN